MSSFPDKWPGVALLLLRAVMGTGLIVEGLADFADKSAPGLVQLALAAALAAVGGLLLVGFLTRIAALVSIGVCVWRMLSSLPGPNVALFDTRTAAILAAAIGIAVMCMGAGAFSVDARLFGRREVIIPQDSET